MLNIVIADDELAARRRIRRLLATDANVSIVGEFSDGASAIEGIRRLAPDVALLDIQMPERDGLEVAAAVSSPSGPVVVFITAFDQYALRAFDVHAVDYLVKPIDAARLHETLARIQSRASESRSTSGELARLSRLIEELRAGQSTATRERRPLDRLLVSVNGSSVVVPAAEIDWIEAQGNYVRIHRGSAALMMRESLTSIEENLDPHLFARVHRGAVVNVSRIKEVQPWFSGASILILLNGQRLTVSRSHRRGFEARFGVQSEE
jgi:two-component system LytT family response regulator